MSLLACDVGSVRIGIARSVGSLAFPMEAVPAGADAVATILERADEIQATAIIVGLPLRLDGGEGPAAQAAREWAHTLAGATKIPVRLVDERLSTVQAQQGLHASGRSTRTSRDRIDSASAVVVLQAVLEYGERTGALPGEVVEGDV